MRQKILNWATSQKTFTGIAVICFILTIISMFVAPDTEYNGAPVIFAMLWYLVSTGGEGFKDDIE